MRRQYQLPMMYLVQCILKKVSVRQSKDFHHLYLVAQIDCDFHCKRPNTVAKDRLLGGSLFSLTEKEIWEHTGSSCRCFELKSMFNCSSTIPYKYKIWLTVMCIDYWCINDWWLGGNWKLLLQNKSLWMMKDQKWIPGSLPWYRYYSLVL